MSKLSNDEKALELDLFCPTAMSQDCFPLAHRDELGHCSASPQPLVTRRLPTCTRDELGVVENMIKITKSFGGQFDPLTYTCLKVTL